MKKYIIYLALTLLIGFLIYGYFSGNSVNKALNGKIKEQKELISNTIDRNREVLKQSDTKTEIIGKLNESIAVKEKNFINANLKLKRLSRKFEDLKKCNEQYQLLVEELNAKIKKLEDCISVGNMKSEVIEYLELDNHNLETRLVVSTEEIEIIRRKAQEIAKLNKSRDRIRIFGLKISKKILPVISAVIAFALGALI